jgi:hypothetical protein
MAETISDSFLMKLEFKQSFSDLNLRMNESQLKETSMFSPSLASVTTTQHSLENAKLSKSIVNTHRDGIPPEDLAFFSCSSAGTSHPTTARVSTVLTTAGSSSLSPAPSLKLARSDWTK